MKFRFTTLFATFLLLSTIALQAQTREFTFNNTAQSEGFTVEQNTRSSLKMRHVLKQLQILNITDNGYTGDILQGGTDIVLPANPGEPSLPSFSRFVAVPNGANAHIEMSYRSMTTLQNVDLLPAAPIKFDTDNSPNTYEKNLSIYNTDAFFPAQPITASEPFSMRGVQTVAITVTPFQYNPVTKELRVYDDLQFDVRFDGGNGEFGDTRLRSPYWDPILMQNLVNYNQLPAVDYEARMQEWVTTRPEGCEYLIVIPNNESFRTYANQLRDYRIKQGILTEVKSLSEMGCTNSSQMETYFHNAYNNWDIPPVAVLLLGDHNSNMSLGIPAQFTYHSIDYGNCITDNFYADVTGDNLPEMAFSRLVAANAAEAQMMVSKQIEYEFTNPNMDATSYDHPITALGWQNQRWFQICSEVVGGYWRNQGKHPVRINAIYDGEPGNSWSTNQNTPMVVNYFGPNGTGYIPASPADLGGWTGGTARQVVNSVNNGCMLLQHRDHGYYQGWGEPDFDNSNVSQMDNVGKMTFVNTINCQTGTFDYYSECLVEAFMRRTSNGQNAGAVGCIGPTQTSYSFVNDVYAWGMYDQYDPQFMPTYGPYANYEGNWRPAFGNVAGKYFLQQSSWPSNPDKKAITLKMFTAHCDAFLTLFTQVPTAMTVNHPTQITPSTNSISVSAPYGAVIALTHDNNILAVAAATGFPQNITFQAQPSNTDITIVVTKQDHLRYESTVQVINDYHLSLTGVAVNDGNNAQLESGEQATFDMIIKNDGSLTSSEATATLGTRTPLYVTINQNTISIPAMESGQTIDLNNVFDITVSDTVPNGTNLEFTLAIISGSHVWMSDFAFDAFAPDLKVSDIMSINDGTVYKGNSNGRLDPGENAKITFTYSNIGGATANNVAATLTTTAQQYIHISQPTVTTATVHIGETVELTYNISVAASMPRGEEAQFILHAATGSYTDIGDFAQRVGLETVNFENGLDGLEWQNDPEHPWTITTTNPYAGQYCLQSGTIGLNASSTLSLPFNVENETDEIRFYRRANCHNSDYLKFYIDNTEIQQWNGNLSWDEMVIPVTQGEHMFTWTYEKDGSGTAGDDRVWIDDIILPVRHLTFACNAGANQNICQETAQMEAYVIGEEHLLWTTNGDGSFDQNDILNPMYTPGEQDIANKTVTLTLTATNEEGETLSDQMAINFHEAPSIIMADEDGVCEGETFQGSAVVNEAGSVSWTTNGDGSFDHPNNLSANYTPGEQDKANGQVTLTLKAISEYGCGDAEHNLVLTVYPLQHTEIEIASCGTYSWNGIQYNEEGYYEQTLQSSHGCDSTVVMHLTMVDAYNVEVEQNACESYVWGGMVLYESGTYEHTFTSINGCDSTVVMHLTINHPTEGIEYVEACDYYEWNGLIISESGDYLQVFTNNMGCDSIVQLHLTIFKTPVIETIQGDTDVDVRLMPSSTYTTDANSSSTHFAWDIAPQEAGSLDAVDNTVTIVWSKTYKGEAILKVAAENECGQSEKTTTINVKNSTDVNEYGISAKIYPNPTNGIVNIEAEGLHRLAVTNTLGQILYDRKVESDNTQINMTQFGAGTYLVRIYTDSGTTIRRINVIR
jgi:hypothetical protein